MGSLTDFNTKRMHAQLHGRANFSELAQHEERRRILKVRWICYTFSIIISFIWFILILFNGFPSSSQDIKFFVASIVLVILLAIIGYFTGRKKRINISRLQKYPKKNNWEKINKIPDWAFKRMNKKHKNKVKGEHYIYLREGGKYYRKKYR